MKREGVMSLIHYSDCFLTHCTKCLKATVTGRTPNDYTADFRQRIRLFILIAKGDRFLILSCHKSGSVAGRSVKARGDPSGTRCQSGTGDGKSGGPVGIRPLAPSIPGNARPGGNSKGSGSVASIPPFGKRGPGGIWYVKLKANPP